MRATTTSPVGVRRTAALIAAAAALVGSALVAMPVAFAADPAAPVVTSVGLTSSATKVTSSAGKVLHVQVSTFQGSSGSPDETSVGDSLAVTLYAGKRDVGETHTWQVPIPSSAFAVSDDGAGTLDVPSANLAPYGKTSLSFAPVGDSTTATCQGQPLSKRQPVTLTGTFFFDTQSSGRHQWGTVGHKKKAFTFSTTNVVTWSYENNDPSCGGNFPSLPCFTGVFWDVSHGKTSLSGSSSGRHSFVFATRLVDLDQPSGATRSDEVRASTDPLDPTVAKDGNATMKVSAIGKKAVGSAMLTSTSPAFPSQVPCGQSSTETAKFWTGTYQNGKTRLKVKEQIFGSLKVADSANASFTQEKSS